MTWRRKCVVCGAGVRTGMGKCATCRRRQQQICGSHKHGVNCITPHPDLEARLRRFTERAAREQPLFDGTERRRFDAEGEGHPC